MKKLSLVILWSLAFLASAGEPPKKLSSGYLLAVCQSHVQSHVLLFEKDSTGKVVEAVEAFAWLHNKPLTQSDQPGNINHLESASHQFRMALKRLNSKLSDRYQLTHLDKVGFFIAGYDEKDDPDDEELYQRRIIRELGKVLSAQNVTVGSSMLSSDLHLISEASREAPETHEGALIDDVNLIYSSSGTAVARVRAGEVSISPIKAHYLEGGFYELGMQVRKAYGEELEEEGEAQAVQTLLQSYLTHCRGTPEKEWDDQWYEGSPAKAGIISALLIAEPERPDELDAEDWFIARSAISALIYPGGGAEGVEGSFLKNFIQSVYWHLDGPVSQREGMPLRVMGDFPWYGMGLASVMKEVLGKENAGKVKWFDEHTYRAMVVRAAKRIMENQVPAKDEL